MLERDPQVAGDRVGRGDAAPIIDHRLLHPLEVHGVVHMTHVVDVGGSIATGWRNMAMTA